jgi:hypothetical protein
MASVLDSVLPVNPPGVAMASVLDSVLLGNPPGVAMASVLDSDQEWVDVLDVSSRRSLPLFFCFAFKLHTFILASFNTCRITQYCN